MEGGVPAVGDLGQDRQGLLVEFSQVGREGVDGNERRLRLVGLVLRRDDGHRPRRVFDIARDQDDDRRLAAGDWNEFLHLGNGIGHTFQSLGRVQAAAHFKRVVGQPRRQIPALLGRSEAGFGAIGVDVLPHHHLQRVAAVHEDAAVEQGAEHLANVLCAKLSEIRQAAMIDQEKEGDRTIIVRRHLHVAGGNLFAVFVDGQVGIAESGP